MAAEPGAIILEAPPGEWPLRLVWDPTCDARSRFRAGGRRRRSPWRAEPELDWERAEALLLVSALFEDGRALALAPFGRGEPEARPRPGPLPPRVLRWPGRRHRGTPLDRVRRRRPPAANRGRAVDRPLLAPAPRRRGPRGEVDVEVEGNGVRREVVAMSFRLDGSIGAGPASSCGATDGDPRRDLGLRGRAHYAASGLVHGGPGRDRGHGGEPGPSDAANRRARRRESALRARAGQIAETDFLAADRRELAAELGHEPELHRFSEIYFDALTRISR